MRRMMLTIAAISFGLLAAFGAGTAVASAPASSCWRVLVNDEYDGRIASSYQLQCYRTAVDHIPCDAIYGALCRDLERSMASGVARLRDRGIAVNAATVIPAPGTLLAAKRHGGAISGAFVVRLAIGAILVGLLVAWVIVRLRRPSRR